MLNIFYGKGMDIEKFFRQLKEEGTIRVILEPGDCTRYEMYIIHDEFVNVFVIPDKHYSIARSGVHPSDLGLEYKHSRCLYADVINGCPKYYDWEKACPMEDCNA